MPVSTSPAEVAHVHVHSLRVRSGIEVLVARVTSNRGTAGYGFAFNLEPWVARDMATWDAAAREAGVPLWKLLGGTAPPSIGVAEGSGGLDPWAAGSAGAVRAQAPKALLAPHGHPWEVAWCATLAASLGGGVTVLVPEEPAQPFVTLPDEPGIGVDWSLEPGFAALAWVKLDRA